MVSKLATFRTDSDIWENFQAKAKANGTNASALLQGYLRDYIDNRIDSNLDKAPINYGIDNSLDSRIDAALESKLDACIDERIDNKLESILQRVASLENAIATSTSEATAPAKKPIEIDNQEPETLPIIDAIEATNIADPSMRKPLSDELSSDDSAAPDTILLNKKQLCDRLKLNYKNLSTNAGKQNMTADSFMLHTAKQQGEIWEKAESNGREALWKLVEVLIP